MSTLSWITAEPSVWLMVPLTGVGIYVAMIALTRIAGLRSFSRMFTLDTQHVTSAIAGAES